MNYYLKSLILFPMNVLYTFSPKKCLELMFRLKQGKKLNLETPQTYNEKLQWIKLFYVDDRMGLCGDKYAVRSYVEQAGLGETLNTLLWSGFNPDEIPFDELPEKFVIKTTHGSGFNIICKNRAKLNREQTIKKLKKWLKIKYLKCYGEHWYGVEKPRIIVESYLENEDGTPLYDYKFFCFNGEPKYVYVDTWKDGEHHINMYDIDFNLLKDVSLGYPRDFSNIKPPENYEQLKKIAKTLASDFPHVRVDLYSVNNKVYFGEMTFSKGAGFDKIKPYEFDVEMGSWFKIPG